jgi:hypothetical protein
MSKACSSMAVMAAHILTAALAGLHRARSRCRFRVKQAEDLAQCYRDKLAGLEARTPGARAGGVGPVPFAECGFSYSELPLN